MSSKRLAIQGRDPTNLEKEVAQIFDDITNSSKKKIKAELRKVQVAGAKEFVIREDDREVQRVLLIYVTYPSLRTTQKYILDILSAVETKKDIITFIIAKRMILSKWIKKHRSQMRPRNRTLTSVHDNILEDLITPASITGRRIRFRGGRNKFYRIYVNEEAKSYLENRVEPIKFIYNALTNRSIDIEFKSEPVYHTVKAN